jgi:putative MFS transporter
VPPLEPRLVTLLGLVALALFFESYDISMLTSALSFIARDLAIAEGDLGEVLAVIRLGSLPALLVVPFTDRIGRRRVFLATVVGSAVATVATAFVQTATQFIAVQMVTRVFMVAGAAAAVVIVTEEFPAEHRGWGIGMLGALAACGHGLGAILFSQVNALPWGWRTLYVVGVVPLLLVPLLRREVRETHRFARHREARAAPDGVRGWLRPLVDLARTHPGRALLLALAAFLFAVGESPVYQFTGYFTLTVHGWSPAEYAAMVLGGGAIGIIGNVVAGRLGDRLGRRLVGAVFLAVLPAAAWLLYRGPGWAVPLGFTSFVFCETAGLVVVRALSTELFPTSHRATAAGWVSFVMTIGWAAGLAIVGAGTQAPGDMARMTSWLSLVVALGGLVLLLLPETRRRELEAISEEHEDVARGAALLGESIGGPLPAVVELPIEDALDLHPFAPAEVPSVVASYVEAAHDAGFDEVRIIHGRGRGVQRERVRRVLGAHPLVVEARDAPPERGGWGATVVRLKGRG